MAAKFERGTKLLLRATVNAETGPESGLYWINVEGYPGLIAIDGDMLLDASSIDEPGVGSTEAKG
jgi:hypothetical protein